MHVPQEIHVLCLFMAKCHMYIRRNMLPCGHSYSCLGHNSLRACKVSKAESRSCCSKQTQREMAQLCLLASLTLLGKPAAETQLFTAEMKPGRSGIFKTSALPLSSQTTVPGFSVTLSGLTFYDFPSSFNYRTPHPTTPLTHPTQTQIEVPAIVCSAMTIFTEETAKFLHYVAGLPLSKSKYHTTCFEQRGCFPLE